MNAAVTRHILLVEDNPADADLVREHLAGTGFHGGYEIHSVTRLDHAIAHLEDARVDAVLLDLGLPDGQGLQSVRTLRGHGDFPIVVLTGNSDDALALACVDAGADDYLCKGETGGTSLRRALSYAIARRREQLLRERSRTLFENLNLIVLELDREGKIDYVNGFFYRLTGWSRHETMYRDVFNFIPADQRPRARELYSELIERNLNPHFEVPLQTKPGAERIIAWHNSVMRDVQGRAIGSISIGEDITDRRLLETRLRHAQKMEGIGRLAGGVAHDFNNILTAILGNAELLQRDLPADSPSQALLDEVRDAATSASRLTAQLLTFSRRQLLAPQPVAVNGAISGLQRMLERIIGEHIELVTQLAPDVGSVLVDPGQFEQVLVNLVVNARDAMATGGALTIRSERLDVDEENALAHTLPAPGSYVLLSISDTGSGMDRDVQARIFEPFFTTKAPGQGTGLGLATVYGIVQQCGGTVSVYSEVGIGSRFKVYLPRTDATPTDVTAGSARPEARRGVERVLLVEDNDAVRQLAQQVLARHGYTVHAARDGAAGLALLEQLGGEVDLILTDVVMPVMGGLELVERVRAAGHRLPVVYMSGYATDAIERGGTLDADSSFLQKPFSRDALLHLIAEVLDRR